MPVSLYKHYPGLTVHQEQDLTPVRQPVGQGDLALKQKGLVK